VNAASLPHETGTETPTRWISHLPPLLALALALVVLVVAPLEAWRWYRSPFLGALFEPNHVVSLINGPDWAAKAAGVEFPDRLVAVDGEPLGPQDDLLSRLAPRHEIVSRLAEPASQPVRLDFVERETGTIYSVTVEPRAPALFDLAGLNLVPYVVGLAFAGLGMWVYALRWRTRAGRIYLILCSALVWLTAGFLDMNTTHRLVRLWATATPLAGTALVALALDFPWQTHWVRQWPALRWLVWAPGLLAIVRTNWQLFNGPDPWAYIDSWVDNYLLVTICLALFFALFMARMWYSGSAVVRQQCRVIVLGALLAFGPVLLFYLLPTILTPALVRFLPILYFPALVVFPLSVAYAILRYRMPQLDRFFHRQVSYGLMTLIVVALYFALVSLFSAALGQRVAANDPLLVSLALFSMVVLFNPLRNGAQRAVDRLFYRHRADYARELQLFAQALAAAADLGQVAAQALVRLRDTLLPDQALVYLFDSRTQDYVAHGAEAPPFGREGEVALRLRDAEGPLSLAPDSVDGFDLSGEWAVVAQMRLALLAPLRAGPRLAGWLALGPRMSGEPYTREDLEFAGALAAQTALAVEKVHDERERRRLEADRERIRRTFGRVVAPRVRDKLLAEASVHGTRLAGTREVVTTLFADVRGYSSVSEKLRPEDLFALLNDHLNLAAQAVLAHEGTIDKFLGDAVMALFNAPDPQPDHTLRAVRAALDMQARLAAYRREQTSPIELHFGVGISVGEAIVGNVGTAELFNFTAIGDVVNLAKRLQEIALPGQVLLSAAAFEAVQDHVRARPLDPIQVKGRAAVEQVYEVLEAR
jgi:class 3 adenylate cyclase